MQDCEGMWNTVSFLQIFFIILILFFFTIGIYSNLYIYQAFRADIVFSGALLPYGGYIFGALLAWICRLEWKLIKVSSKQGHIYVGNEYSTFLRTMLLVCQKIKMLRKIILNGRQICLFWWEISKLQGPTYKFLKYSAICMLDPEDTNFWSTQHPYVGSKNFKVQVEW